jgi:hypothetical protein
MSKKLIAVAAAAALALTALVAPANATNSALEISLQTTPPQDGTGVNGVAVVGSGLTSTAAWEVAVPSQDVIRATNTASRSALALEIETRSNNAAVAVTSTGSVKLLTAAQLAAATTTSATGTQSLSLTTNDTGDVVFYAYNTSTSAGSITVVESGTTPASNTIWVKGTTNAANAYKLAVTAPTTAGIGSTVEFTATVVDMFGNAVTTADVQGDTLGGDATVPGTVGYNSVSKVYEGDFTSRTTAGQVALLVKMDVSAAAVKAFGAKTTSVFVNINAADLQAVVTALQAEVAALKADYNKLAARWNKKVDNKRTLKKKVALK